MTTLNYWFTVTEGIAMSNRNTVASAHERIDGIEKEVIAMQTEMRIQFKDLFGRVKRMEAIMIGTTGFIIALLVAVLTKMGWQNDGPCYSGRFSH